MSIFFFLKAGTKIKLSYNNYQYGPWDKNGSLVDRLSP